MAHIFRYPCAESKGIVVFTHKECQYFFKGRRALNLPRALGFLKPILKLSSYLSGWRLSRKYRRRFSALRRSCFIGMHVGGRLRFSPKFGELDFLLSSDHALTNPEEVPAGMRVIHMRAENCVPRTFTVNHSFPKYWDILCVANNSTNKHLRQFLDAVKRTYQAGKPYRVLLVNLAAPHEHRTIGYDAGIVRHYQETFTDEEKQWCTFLRLSPELGCDGLSYSQMAYFFQCSRVFALFSEVEGGPRVVYEALKTGLPVVMPSWFEGGARDFLDAHNAVFFDSYDTAHESLIETVEDVDRFEVPDANVEARIGEDVAVEQFRLEFARMFADRQVPFDGVLANTDNLNTRLCGHYQNVGWSIDRHTTADIQSPGQFEVFERELFRAPAVTDVRRKVA